MQEYQQRVIEEKKELDIKITNLSKFLHTDTYESLTQLNKDLLDDQLNVMLQYSGILSQRIELF